MAFRISSNIDGLIARNRMRGIMLSKEMLAAEKKNMQQIKKDAIEITSQNIYTVNSLHPIYPYSHTSFVPLMAPYFVNQQSGKMSESWKVRTVPSGDGILSSIWNEQDYSRFFNGKETERMIARPVLQYLLLKSRKRRLDALHEAQVALFRDKYGSNYLNRLINFGGSWWR